MKINEAIPAYLKYMRTCGRSPYTFRIAKYDLLTFARYLETELLFEVQEATEIRVTSHAVARLGRMIAANIIRINVNVDKLSVGSN